MSCGVQIVVACSFRPGISSGHAGTRGDHEVVVGERSARLQVHSLVPRVHSRGAGADERDVLLSEGLFERDEK